MKIDLVKAKAQYFDLLSYLGNDGDLFFSLGKESVIAMRGKRQRLLVKKNTLNIWFPADYGEFIDLEFFIAKFTNSKSHFESFSDELKSAIFQLPEA